MNFNPIPEEDFPNEYFGFVYRIIFPNGKFYIGQTKKRVNQKYFGSGGFKFKNAVNKYGKENLKREILKFCNNEAELGIFEKLFILKFKTIDKNFGYNFIKGDANFQFRNPMSIPGMGKFAASRVDKQKKIESTLKWYAKNGTNHISGKNNPMYGVKRDNYKPPFLGRKHTEETKKKKYLNLELAEEIVKKLKRKCLNLQNLVI